MSFSSGFNCIFFNGEKVSNACRYKKWERGATRKTANFRRVQQTFLMKYRCLQQEETALCNKN